MKKEQALHRLYAAACLVFTALFVFEVPYVVFYAPVFLFTVCAAYRIYCRRPVRVPPIAVVFALYTAAFLFFAYDPRQGLYYQTYIHIQAVLLFLLGLHFFTVPDPLRRAQTLERWFIAVSFMYIIYVGLIFAHHYLFTAADLEDRFYYSLWYPNVTKPATVISMSLLVPFAYGAYALFFGGRGKKVLGAAFIAVTLLVNIYTATRTLVYLTPVVLLLVFCFWCLQNKKHVRLCFGVCGACIAVLAGVALFYHLNKEMLLASFGDSVFSRFLTYGIGSKGRRTAALYVLKNFSFTYIGSGWYSSQCGVPHNIWLYVYDYGGIVSLAVYCVFTVLLLRRVVLFLKNRAVPLPLKCLLTVTFGLVMAEYCLEPFILPLPSFYMLTLFLFGCISGLAQYHKKEEENAL